MEPTRHGSFVLASTLWLIAPACGTDTSPPEAMSDEATGADDEGNADAGTQGSGTAAASDGDGDDRDDGDDGDETDGDTTVADDDDGNDDDSDDDGDDGPSPRACVTANETVLGLAEGVWLEVAAPMEAVLPPESELLEVWGNSGPAAIMGAWNGGAFDTVRDRLIVTGGGHWDYAGNELYAFDVGTLQWERLTDPSSLQGWSSGDDVMPDGLPPARHTYNGIVYLPPPVDRLWINGGSVYGPGANSPRSWTFDFDASEWSEVATSPFTGEGTAVYDADRQRVYDNFNYHGMATYDVVGDAWTVVHDPSEFGSLYRTAAYDPVRSQMVLVGQGETLACDVSDAGEIDCATAATSGATALESAGPVGFVYAAPHDRFVAWSGGSSVYVLDPESLVWSEEVGVGAVPTAASNNGTFGRWQYSECHDAFVGVNHIDEPVFIYRRQGGR